MKPKQTATSPSALRTYWKKRDFVRTPEPSGRRGSAERGRAVGTGIFVVQKHAARRLHYDFRLELDGTLKSWAVPKGPSLDPAHKRLAVHVEDHPLEYAAFEGIIPPEQYGAGTVLLWDRGQWHAEGDAREGYRKGALKFRLDGQKLRGAWTLVRMGRPSRDEEKENWLLIKERDEEARSGPAAEIVASLTDSVESGRGLDEIAQGRPRVWQSNRAVNGERRAGGEQRTEHSARRTSKRSSISSTHRQSAAGLRQPLTSAPSSLAIPPLPGAGKMALPDWIAPQLATLVDGMPAGDQWIHEIKYDGYRIVCRVQRGKARLFTRNQHDWTDKLRPQAHAIESMGLTDAWLDGEVVVFTRQGTADFQALQNAFDLRSPQPIVYCLFDLLYLNGYDLRPVPLLERKRVLASLLDKGAGRPVLRYSDHLVGGGEAAFEEACRQGLEGLMAKRADAPYRSGRNRSWLKIKCEQRQEFVIGGYTDPAGSRQGFGALLVGFYEKDGLRYAGKVGTGFTDVSLRQLEAKLKPLEQARPSFINPPSGYEARGVHWVKPELVGEVRFAEWTKEGILRQPSFQGLRQDKRPKAIGRERSQHAVERREPKPAPSSSGVSGSGEPRAGAARSRAKLSHPERVMYPDLGLTKEGLARYYEAVAEWILPHLQGRPLTLVRCPQGYQECFYQKHINEAVPKAIGRVDIKENDGVGTYMVADTFEAVLGLVQMGVLELHTWGALKDKPDRPDRLTFDLDPDPSVPWTYVIEAAQLVKGLLEELGLTSFVKTTGGKGLHVVTPIQRTQGWEEAKDFAKAVAEHMVALIPQRFTSNMAKRARKGKIFIDYLRNARGATAVAAYSTRAKPGAPVSMPLAWEELSHDLVSDHFTVANTPERLKRLARDPWAGYRNAATRLTDSMKARLRRAA